MHATYSMRLRLSQLMDTDDEMPEVSDSWLCSKRSVFASLQDQNVATSDMNSTARAFLGHCVNRILVLLHRHLMHYGYWSLDEDPFRDKQLEPAIFPACSLVIQIPCLVQMRICRSEDDSKKCINLCCECKFWACFFAVVSACFLVMRYRP